MKIAIIGIRGIPVVYSGFETLAEKLSLELVKRGHKVTVYCRAGWVSRNKPSYKGVQLVGLPTVRSKNLETLSHSFVSTVHACFLGSYDLVYYLGVGSTLFSWLPRLFGVKTVVNVDGLDWKREKWGIIGRLYLGISEYLAVLFPNAVITDSLFIKRYYKRKFKKETKHLPYGCIFSGPSKKEVLGKYGLKRRKYIVWVGRLVPDNHIDELLRAFSNLKTTINCVIIGDDVGESDYKRKLYRLGKKDERVVFTGFLDRPFYASLVKDALAYIETKRSGGTHPSLVEAMGFGSLIVSNSHPANKEVLGETALYYKAGIVADLAEKLRPIAGSRDIKKMDNLRKLSKKRAKEKYNWQEIINNYEEFFQYIIIQSSRQ